MPKGYTHLTPDDRCHIEVLLKRGDSHRAIGRLLGRPASTIRREISRNSGKRGYRKTQAESLSCKRRSDARCGPSKMTPDMVLLIEAKLVGQQWSPQQISGFLKHHPDASADLQGGTTSPSSGTPVVTGACASISHERIYQHVWRDKKDGGLLWKHLRHQGKKYNKRKGVTAGRGCIPGRVDIDMRPAVVDEKARIGDWEIDTVIGANHKGVLVTAVERLSKYTIIEFVPNKTSKAVTAALIARMEAISDKVLTITADNGKEFAGHADIAAALKADVYFAKPYQSWQRGLNEHTNGLIRQYFPKHMTLDKLTKAEVDKVENLLNSRPRKILGFKTPQDVFSTPPPGALQC